MDPLGYGTGFKTIFKEIIQIFNIFLKIVIFTLMSFQTLVFFRFDVIPNSNFLEFRISKHLQILCLTSDGQNITTYFGAN